jgi:D-cysteine desulfhydrase
VSAPARIELALTPTPVLRLERLSRRFGVELYVKRDDLAGSLEAGHAVRKLEFLVGEALQQGADTLITSGPPESDSCRAVAAVAARLGLRAVLAITSPRPDVYDGDLLLDHLLGAEVRYLGARPARPAGVLADIEAEIRAAGGTPYVIPENGSNEVGALGYLECAVELAEQIGHGAPAFDAVVVGVSAGGCQAGLLMGKQLVGLPAQVVGVPVAGSADQARERVAAIVDGAIRRFGFAIEVPRRILLLDGDDVAEPIPSGTHFDTVVDTAREEGVLFDPITGRAFATLLDALTRDARAFGTRVCFIHTGGLFGLFPHRQRLSRLLGDRT